MHAIEILDRTVRGMGQKSCCGSPMLPNERARRLGGCVNFPNLAGTRVMVARSEQMGGCGQSTGIYTPDSSGSGMT